MMFACHKKLLVLGILMLTASACASSPTTRYYVLKPTSAPSPAGGNAGLAVGVGPAQIPKRLDQSNIMTVGQGNEVTLAQSHEWAEPLDESIIEVLGENLANTLGTSRIYRHPWNYDVEMDHRIPLTVIRLGGTLGVEAYLDVRWSMLNREGIETVRRTSSFRRPLPDATHVALAAAISDMLGELSREIAGFIQGTGAPRPPVMAPPPAPGPGVVPGGMAPGGMAPPPPPPSPQSGLQPLGEMGTPPPPEIRVGRGSAPVPQSR